jgi:hypothetical protein
MSGKVQTKEEGGPFVQQEEVSAHVLPAWSSQKQCFSSALGDRKRTDAKALIHSRSLDLIFLIFHSCFARQRSKVYRCTISCVGRRGKGRSHEPLFVQFGRSLRPSSHLPFLLYSPETRCFHLLCRRGEAQWWEGNFFRRNKSIASWSTSSLCFSSSALRYETKLKVQLARSQTNYHGQ